MQNLTPVCDPIFRYTRSTTPKRVASVRGPSRSPRHCNTAFEEMSLWQRAADNYLTLRSRVTAPPTY